MPPRKPLPPPPSEIVARCYIRVSKVNGREEDNTRDFQSPEQQLAPSRKRSAMYDWRFDEEASVTHADIDQSGFRKTWRKRPGIVAHLEAAARGEFQVLIVLKLSRLARNVREGLEIFEEFEKLGVRIVCITEDIDTSTAAGRMMRTLMLAFAEWQAEELSDYAAAAARTRAKSGKAPPVLPAWIRKDDATGANVIDEEHASAVRRMIELRCQNYGSGRICRILNAEGYTPPVAGVWLATQVAHYLRPAYLDRFRGVATWKLNDGSTHIIENAYPAIATDEEVETLHSVSSMLRDGFSDARAGLENASRLSGVRGAAASGDTKYLVSSLIHCGVCGNPLRSSSAGVPGRRVYNYRCHNCYAERSQGVIVDAISIEEAAERICRFAVIEGRKHIVAQPVKRKPRPKTGRTAAQIRDEMEWVVMQSAKRRLDRTVFDECFARLETELAAAELAEAESTPAQLLAIAEAAFADGDLRTVFLSLIGRIDAPVFLPSVVLRTGVERRCARFTLAGLGLPAGETFILPLYRVRWSGERAILFPSGEPVIP